ncbi:hypothetical protein JCM10207_005140 [Rhodosporidiobolus poonsookiae]
MSLSAKQRFAKWIGHDPAITEVASTTQTLKGFTQGSGSFISDYFKSLFPFHRWILNYNLQWAAGDLIAGLTVGMVVVPQSMSYAKIATLSPEFGLYSSFVGVMIYALFATSKDVTIGPVAVMSLQVAKVIQHVQDQPDGKDIPGYIIGTTLALICGIIVLGIGLLRLGWIVEFISQPAVAGFMTGSAISIVAGQVPTLMGYSKLFDTRAATYKVIINSFKHLPDTTRDAAFGLVGLAFLLATKFLFAWIERRAKSPAVRRAAFFAGTFRTAFFIIFATVFSWVYCRNYNSKSYPISILKTVPSGFQHMSVPKWDNHLIGLLGPQLPVSTIVLLLEHIAISKSFGRVNNYKIDPNQELVAIGVNNVFSTFFGAYPSTGSFSRSAIKSKAGVRTPIAGWITGIVVVIALYALTGAFYWIPNAGLAAVIIDAVAPLVSSPRNTYNFWLVSPIEAVIFLAAVIITIFTTIEIGIYFSVAASAALLLLRMAKPRIRFLGRVRVRNEEQDGTTQSRDVYVPLNPDGVRNPSVAVDAPPAGVIVVRMEEAMLYPNASRYADQIADYVREITRNGQDFSLTSQGDRPWNDPGPNRFQKKGRFAEQEALRAELNAQKPLLKSLVFDFSGVSNVDTTSIQNLVDLRRVVSRYAGQDIPFHFATILSPWIKRALLAGGFGRDPTQQVAEVAPIVPQDSNADQRQAPPPLAHQQSVDDIKEDTRGGADLEAGRRSNSLEKVPYAESYAGSVVGDRFQCFHLDLPSAVAAASGNARW